MNGLATPTQQQSPRFARDDNDSRSLAFRGMTTPPMYTFLLILLALDSLILIAVILMQAGQGRQQPLAHIGADGGGRLAAADQLRAVEIDGNELRKRAAEIDEESEGRHFDTSVEFKLLKKLRYWS